MTADELDITLKDLMSDADDMLGYHLCLLANEIASVQSHWHKDLRVWGASVWFPDGERLAFFSNNASDIFDEMADWIPFIRARLIECKKQRTANAIDHAARDAEWRGFRCTERMRGIA